MYKKNIENNEIEYSEIINYSIVLDTNLFGKKNTYNFKNGKIVENIKMMSGYSNIKFYMPDIVLNELKSHISENIKTTYKKMENGYLKKYCCKKKEELNKEYMEDIYKFIKESKMNILDCGEYSNMKEVNEWYFNTISPFEERKKEEFPDAMIVSTIMNYFKKSSDEIIVISSDKGFINAVKKHTNYEVMNSLSPLLEKLFGFDETKINRIKNFISKENILSKRNTYNIITNDETYYDDVDDIEYNINYIDVMEKIDNNNYIIDVNTNLKFYGDFSLIDYGVSVFDEEYSAIFYRQGKEIHIEDYDIFAEITFDEKGNVIKISELEMEKINLSDYIEQLEFEKQKYIE